jgi:hypothetical protein
MIWENGMISDKTDEKTAKELEKYFKEQLPHKDDYDGWEKYQKDHNNNGVRELGRDFIFKTTGEMEKYFLDGYGKFHNDENRTKALLALRFIKGLYI